MLSDDVSGRIKILQLHIVIAGVIAPPADIAGAVGILGSFGNSLITNKFRDIIIESGIITPFGKQEQGNKQQNNNKAGFFHPYLRKLEFQIFKRINRFTIAAYFKVQAGFVH
jgi:hypothetical protein